MLLKIHFTVTAVKFFYRQQSTLNAGFNQHQVEGSDEEA